MLNFYPNFHVIILLLVLMISRGGEAADLSLWLLFTNSSENARMTNSWTGSHLFSCERSASLTERTNMARPPKTTCEPAGMYSPVGLCLGETSLTNRTLLGWGVVMAGAA